MHSKVARKQDQKQEEISPRRVRGQRVAKRRHTKRKVMCTARMDQDSRVSPHTSIQSTKPFANHPGNKAEPEKCEGRIYQSCALWQQGEQHNRMYITK